MSGIPRLFSGLRAASSGLTAERIRIDVIAHNIANAQTTRTPQGGPFRRQIVHLEPVQQDVRDGRATGGGVRVARVVADEATPFELVHDPGHPDANADGMVELPNVDAVREMADLMTAVRAYEANLKSQEIFLRMAQRALEMVR